MSYINYTLLVMKLIIQIAKENRKQKLAKVSLELDEVQQSAIQE